MPQAHPTPPPPAAPKDADYPADNENSMRSSGINIETF
jgi:hypothetical protein